MWKWSLNWSAVTPHIVIGSCPMTPDDIRRIYAKSSASVLFSLQHDDCLAYWRIDYEAMCRTGSKLKIEMARCPIRDFDITDMRKNLPSTVSTLAQLLTAGHRVYVHCTAGLGRSPLTVLGYLNLIEDYPEEDAIGIIKNSRPNAVPAWEAFYGACEDLEKSYRYDIQKRAYELYEAGVNDNPLMDWKQGKSDIFRIKLTAKRPLPHLVV